MATFPRRLIRADGLRPWQHAAIFAIAFVLIASKQPDSLFHAQFYGEDGNAWYADAYNLGWIHGLTLTPTGYFFTLPRLASALALLVPLSRAPLVLNLIAFAVHALPVNLLLSSRSVVWGSLPFRVLLALSYLALPDSPEPNANIVNAHWILALCALLLVLGSPPRSFLESIWDAAILVLSGLTGPFCIFELPIAVLVAYRNRSEHRRWVSVGPLGICSVLQAWSLLVLSPFARAHWGPLGATPALFVRILGGNVFVGALLGENLLASTRGSAVYVFLLCVAVAGCLFSAAMMRGARLEMRLLGIFATMVFATSLISPSVEASAGMTRWEILAGASGIIYWYFPALAFVWLLIDATRRRSINFRFISVPLLVLLCFGIVIQWKRPALPDLNFSEEAERFQKAPAGATFVFPVNPKGWTMYLVKHTPRTHKAESRGS